MEIAMSYHIIYFLLYSMHYLSIILPTSLYIYLYIILFYNPINLRLYCRNHTLINRIYRSSSSLICQFVQQIQQFKYTHDNYDKNMGILFDDVVIGYCIMISHQTYQIITIIWNIDDKYNYTIMATSISKNLSHRRLIKERTNQIYDYSIPHKTAKLLEIKAINSVTKITNQPNKDHQTSIDLDNELDTSLSKRLHSKSGSQPVIKPIKSNDSYQIKSTNAYPRKPRLPRFKSLQALPDNQPIARYLRPSFSVKRLLKNDKIHSQPKLASKENIEAWQQPKQIQKIYSIPKSETDLKQTLKKSSSSKLKLKVKDPFQKRAKLDREFQDQVESPIRKKDEEHSLLSTLNQQQFLEILAKLN